jgi:hypothetical protein
MWTFILLALLAYLDGLQAASVEQLSSMQISY